MATLIPSSNPMLPCCHGPRGHPGATTVNLPEVREDDAIERTPQAALPQLAGRPTSQTSKLIEQRFEADHWGLWGQCLGSLITLGSAEHYPNGLVSKRMLGPQKGGLCSMRKSQQKEKRNAVCSGYRRSSIMCSFFRSFQIPQSSVKFVGRQSHHVHAVHP